MPRRLSAPGGALLHCCFDADGERHVWVLADPGWQVCRLHMLLTGRTCGKTAVADPTRRVRHGSGDVSHYDRYWGAETQRTLQNFKAGRATDLMPEAVVRALGVHKRAAAKVSVLRP